MLSRGVWKELLRLDDGLHVKLEVMETSRSVRVCDNTAEQSIAGHWRRHYGSRTGTWPDEGW